MLGAARNASWEPERLSTYVFDRTLCAVDCQIPEFHLLEAVIACLIWQRNQLMELHHENGLHISVNAVGDANPH
jgi:hypothetical protein